MVNITKDNEKLYEAILSLRNIKECHAFLKDICTPQELYSLQERLRVASLLYTKKLSYRKIQEITGASLTTIGRVARFLNQEDYHGYQLLFERQQRHPSS